MLQTREDGVAILGGIIDPIERLTRDARILQSRWSKSRYDVT